MGQVWQAACGFEALLDMQAVLSWGSAVVLQNANLFYYTILNFVSTKIKKQ